MHKELFAAKGTPNVEKKNVFLIQFPNRLHISKRRCSVKITRIEEIEIFLLGTFKFIEISLNLIIFLFLPFHLVKGEENLNTFKITKASLQDGRFVYYFILNSVRVQSVAEFMDPFRES
jgi:hypothetical protein